MIATYRNGLAYFFIVGNVSDSPQKIVEYLNQAMILSIPTCFIRNQLKFALYSFQRFSEIGAESMDETMYKR